MPYNFAINKTGAGTRAVPRLVCLLIDGYRFAPCMSHGLWPRPNSDSGNARQLLRSTVYSYSETL